MKAFDLDPSLRWLFCFTHPDDELTLVAWIRRLVEAGAEVHLSWTHDTPVREAEARSVASELGVPQANLHFFHGTDGRIAEEMPDLLPRFVELMQTVQPSRVVTTAFEQGHIDHDATNLLVNRSFDGPVFEVPLYHTYLTRFPKMGVFADASGQEVLRLTMQEQRLKTSLARRYPSQTIWRNVVCYSMLNRAALRPPVLKVEERMRLQRTKDYFRPNLPDRLARKVQRSPMWARWILAATRLEASVPVRERVQLL